MNLNDYREQPDSGLFEKIARRVRRRRILRRSGVTVAVVVVAAGIFALVKPASDTQTLTQLSNQAFNQSEVQQLPVSTTDGMEVATVAPASVAPVTVAQQQTPSPVVSTPSIKEIPADIVLHEIIPAPAYYPSDNTNTDAESKNVPEPRRQPTSEQPVAQPQEVDAAPATDSALAAPTPRLIPDKGELSEEPPLHEDNLFWVPNIIVPTGDVDDNRTFSVKFTSAVTQFQITIYNRGGRQVYHSTDPSFVWDGNYKGGTLSQGAYIWVLKFRDSTGKPHEERGTVTLIR